MSYVSVYAPSDPLVIYYIFCIVLAEASWCSVVLSGLVVNEYGWEPSVVNGAKNRQDKEMSWQGNINWSL